MPCYICAFCLASGFSPGSICPLALLCLPRVCVCCHCCREAGLGGEAAVKSSSQHLCSLSRPPAPRPDVPLWPRHGSCSVLSSLSLHVPRDTAPAALRAHLEQPNAVSSWIFGGREGFGGPGLRTQAVTLPSCGCPGQQPPRPISSG